MDDIVGLVCGLDLKGLLRIPEAECRGTQNNCLIIELILVTDN